jgi:hypothetical protein
VHGFVKNFSGFLQLLANPLQTASVLKKTAPHPEKRACLQQDRVKDQSRALHWPDARCNVSKEDWSIEDQIGFGKRRNDRLPTYRISVVKM